MSRSSRANWCKDDDDPDRRRSGRPHEHFRFRSRIGTSSARPRRICSRKACRAQASWQLLWNNPKIHPPERRKTWLACAEHRGWLEDYLQTRGLWKETLPDRPAARRPLEQDS